MNHRGYIIEMTGLAGCGKTHVKNVLLDWLAQDGIPFEPVLSQHKISLRCYFSVLSRTFFFVWAARPQTIIAFIKSFRWVFQVQAAYCQARANNTLLLVDEGVVHKFRALRRVSKVKNIRLSQIDTGLLERLFMPDLIVFVKATKDEILERRQKRGDPYKGAQKMEQAIARLVFTEDDIAYVVNKYPSVSSFVVTNSSVISQGTNEDLRNVYQHIKVALGAKN